MDAKCVSLSRHTCLTVFRPYLFIFPALPLKDPSVFDSFFFRDTKTTSYLLLLNSPENLEIGKNVGSTAVLVDLFREYQQVTKPWISIRIRGHVALSKVAHPVKLQPRNDRYALVSAHTEAERWSCMYRSSHTEVRRCQSFYFFWIKLVNPS